MPSNDVSFNPLRFYMDLWDEATAEDDQRQKLRNLIDSQELILFFRHKGDIFGAPEDSRIVFAKLKHPDEDTPEEWAEEASFTAINLSRALTGDKVESVFSQKDLDAIGVVSPDAVENLTLAPKKKAKKDKGPKPEIELKDRS
jgi:hypothetical protein